MAWLQYHACLDYLVRIRIGIKYLFTRRFLHVNYNISYKIYSQTHQIAPIFFDFPAMAWLYTNEMKYENEMKCEK